MLWLEEENLNKIMSSKVVITQYVSMQCTGKNVIAIGLNTLWGWGYLLVHTRNLAFDQASIQIYQCHRTDLQYCIDCLDSFRCYFKRVVDW